MALTDEQRLLRSVSEQSWQKQVEQTLALCGFDPALTYHTHDSRRSRAGFPDLVAFRYDHRGVTLAVLELKRETGPVTDGQTQWLNAWRALATWQEDPVRMIVGVFRPSQAEELWRLLQEGGPSMEVVGGGSREMTDEQPRAYDELAEIFPTAAQTEAFAHYCERLGLPTVIHSTHWRDFRAGWDAATSQITHELLGEKR